MRAINHAALALLLAASRAWSFDALFLNVTVNGIAQGDMPAVHEDGQYWLQLDAIKKAGLPLVAGESKDFDGIPHLRILGIQNVEAKVDEASLSVALTARAEDLGEHVINMHPSRRPSTAAVAGWSGYLDYQLSAYQSAGSELGYGFAPTLNLSYGNWNFRSSHDYQNTGREDDWLRLGSTLTLDQPELMARATLGDITPNAGALSRSRPMMGLGFSRVFAMQPDFSSSPSFNASTAITTASTAEIYLNGQRVNTVDLAPGMYTFEDLRYYSGMQDVTMVIKDSYGRSQTVSMPFYYDDSLLKAGLHEFSYNVGMARVPGSFNQYDGLAYSAYHRVGVTDWLTLGAQADGANDDRSAGALARLKLGDYGVLATTLSQARHADGTQGTAALAHYRYETPDFNVYASGQQQSEHYLESSDWVDPEFIPHWSANAGFSFGSSRNGSWNFEIARQVGGSEATYNRYRVGYSISPLRQMSISASISRKVGINDAWSGYVNLAWYFDNALNLNTSSQYENERLLNSASISNTPPNGEGWGYSAGVNQTESGVDYNGWVQHKMRYGIADISYYRSQNGDSSSNNWRAAYAGSLAFAGEHLAATRPNADSFAVVDAPGLANVSVYQNGEVIGKTNANGELFIPNLSSYGYQQISLNQADIPMDVLSEKLSEEILTGNTDGRIVHFSGRQITAISGKLQRPDQTPLRNRSLSVDGHTTRGATTLEGDFYLEDLAVGHYTLRAGDDCSATFEITPQEEVVLDIGVLTCQETQR